jgi:hypothetical protein
VLAEKSLLNADPKNRRIFSAGAVGDAEGSQSLAIDHACKKTGNERSR